MDLIAESLRKQITDLLHFRGSLSRMNVLMHKCIRILTDWTQPRILLTFLSLFFSLRWFAPEGNRDWDLSGNLGGFVSGTRHFGVSYLMCLICYGNFEFFPRVTVLTQGALIEWDCGVTLNLASVALLVNISLLNPFCLQHEKKNHKSKYFS